MDQRAGIALAAALCGALAACNNGAKTPTGQVVATLGNQEITMRDVRAELGNYNAPDAKTLKAAENAALRNIIGRDIVANEARKEGLEKTPDFALAKQRAIDSLLVQALQQKITSQVPPATKDEAQRYVDAHPDMFAQRKIYVVDQIQMKQPADPSVVKAMEPLKTFDQIQALLTQNKIPFQRGTAMLDVLTADPRLVDAIQKLPPGELFVLPAGQLLTVNQIKDTRIEPVPADKSVPLAQQLITRQRTEDAVRKRFQGLFGQSVKQVKFSKEFAPMNKMATGSPAAPAPATSAPAQGSAPATSGGA
ncbi:MAG TPA: peptidyl-prolyl cis-trans isomerase [Rhizomicrobium sp.]|nr:peptidyl-prolyl cis-trans isomerase [Rhizomicrobium sp.]